MRWAAAGPRRWVAAGMAVLLSLLGVLAVAGGGVAGAGGGEFVAGAQAVDAVAPSRVVVRQVAPAPQVDRLDVPPAVVDSGPPRRATLPVLVLPAVPAQAVAGVVAAEDVAVRGPPRVSAP